MGCSREDYKEYSERQRMIRPPANLCYWNAQDHIPSVRQMAFDHISIPAISAETERVFSDSKLFIPESRSRLGPAVIESFGACVQIGTSRSIDDDDDDEGERMVIIVSQTRFYSQSSFGPKKRTEPTTWNPDDEA
jgi:hAT family C-terminal dimerisation region